MIKLIPFLIIFTLLLTSCNKQFTASQAKEVEAVRASYENYKKAILEDKGEEAVNYLDSRTVKYYADILEKVRTADENAVNSLSFMDKFQVLMIRMKAKKEEILSFDGKGLIIFAVNNGMVGKDGVVKNSIGEVNIEANFAKGQYIVQGQKTPLYQHFYKEDNQWKIDLTSLFPATAVVFKRLVEESKMSENEYIFELLETISNKKVSREIWTPTEKQRS